ncbi:MAG: hypothetical protein M1831_000756 [Alyxoria varia]|nr:MAG: hypothetical protein M1831_000756 [Alyxoria varia]
MDDYVASLEREYCPPKGLLDAPLVRALAPDYDISDGNDVQKLRMILDGLKDDAEAQEDIHPAASLTNIPNKEDDEYSSHTRIESLLGAEDTSRSQETDTANLSDELRTITSERDSGESFLNGSCLREPYAPALEREDGENKAAWLKEMFPHARLLLIRHILEKCGEDHERAMDELLNHTFFEECAQLDQQERIKAKGIESFSEEHTGLRGRRRDRRHKVNRTSANYNYRIATSPKPRSVVPENVWDSATKDIKFVSDRVDVPYRTIASYYHGNGASVDATIVALIDGSSPKDKTIKEQLDEDIIQGHTTQLVLEFPSITETRLRSLVRLTHPSMIAAQELANVLTRSKASIHRGDDGVILPQYASIATPRDNPIVEESPWDVASHPSRPQVKPSPIPELAVGSDPHMRAAAYSAAQSHAHAQASQAYRRGRSDHLMKSAAGYYGQIARDYAVKGREATAEAADDLVESQSSTRMIDLHGVSAQDGVRITRANLENWWRNRAGNRVKGMDGRTRTEAGDYQSSHFDIVTGTGQHSAGGRAVLGPAVRKMLVKEGWDAGYNNGVWTVFGKR